MHELFCLGEDIRVAFKLDDINFNDTDSRNLVAEINGTDEPDEVSISSPWLRQSNRPISIFID